jgi:UDP-N-acetyl-2-amino-2-deoxyglucuronate dehydrogenase
MDEKARVVVVGCGTIGRVHARAVSDLDGARLVAVSDVKPETAASFADEFACKAYSDYVAMFESEKPDLACVCTPSGTRLDICRTAAQCGVNLLVEKPLDIALSRTKSIIEACETAGVKLGCVFQLRFMPIFQSLKKAVVEGRIGKTILGNAYTICYRSQEYYDSGSWRGTLAQDGGGALINQGIHSVDLLRWIMGDVRSVCAYKANLMHDIEVEDTVTAAVAFESGAMGTIQATTSVYHGINKRLEIFGADGTAIIEDETPVMWQFREPAEGNWAQPVDGGGLKSMDPTSNLVEDVWAHQQQIVDMIDAIREDRQPAIPGFEGHKAVELVLAIYESARTGQKVTLPLPIAED